MVNHLFFFLSVRLRKKSSYYSIFLSLLLEGFEKSKKKTWGVYHDYAISSSPESCVERTGIRLPEFFFSATMLVCRRQFVPVSELGLDKRGSQERH